MTQRTALIFATVLMVCVLIMGAGTLAVFAGKRTASADSTPPASTEAALSVQAADPRLTELLQQRDAQYRAEIEQANTQLRDAYQTIQTLQAQNQELQERELVYQQRLGEAIDYIQIIQNQVLQSDAIPSARAFADEGDDHDD